MSDSRQRMPGSHVDGVVRARSTDLVLCCRASLCAKSSPNDDLTDDPMDLAVVSLSRVLSFTVLTLNGTAN